MDSQGFLDNVKELISVSEQETLFDSNIESLDIRLQELCIGFLKDRGYSVRVPGKYPVNIKELRDLVSLFYGLLNDKYPNHLLPNINLKKDLAIAKQLVEHRMEVDSISRMEALKQCGSIILTVFRNIDVFKFDEPPTFGIFSKNMFWFVNEVIVFMNKYTTNKELIELEKIIDKIDARIEEHYSGGGYSLNALDKMRERLDNRYGKKKF